MTIPRVSGTGRSQMPGCLSCLETRYMAPRPELNPLHVIRERHREHDGEALHIVSYMYMTGYYTRSRVSNDTQHNNSPRMLYNYL